MYTQAVTRTKLAMAQRYSHSLCELMKGQSKLLPLYCFTFLCSGGDGVEKHGPTCNSHISLHGCMENDTEGLRQAEDCNIVYLDHVLGFAYPCCCLKDAVLAVLCNPSARCLQLSVVLVVNDINTQYHFVFTPCRWLLSLDFTVGFEACLIHSVAISNHTLRPVKFHHVGKLFFSCCGGTHTFYHESSGKRKRKEEELVQKTVTHLGIALEMLCFRSAHIVIQLPLLSQKPQ